MKNRHKGSCTQSNYLLLL